MNNAKITDTATIIEKWLRIIVPVVVLIDFSHYFLLGHFKVVGQFSQLDNWRNAVFGLAVLTVAPSIFVLLSGALRVSKRVLFAFLIGGITFSVFLADISSGGKWIDFLISVAIPFSVCIALAATYDAWRTRRLRIMGWSRLFGRVFLLSTSLALGVASFLEVTPVVFPGTYDYPMHHVDAAFGSPAIWFSAWIAKAPLFLRQFLSLIYDSLGWVFLPLIALVLRENKEESLNIWRTYIYALGLAMLCYIFIPVSGPLYAFGSKFFPEHMNELLDIPVVVTTIQPALRNGMPSMHFTSAVTIAFICAALRNKVYFALSIVFVFATSLATMGFGEHYLIDLVVAMPYSVMVSVLLIGSRRYFSTGFFAKIALYLTGLTFAIWMLLIKFQVTWLIKHPGAVQLLSFWSLGLFVVVSAIHVRSVWSLGEGVRAEKTDSISGFLPQDLKGSYWTVCVFFASGAAGLIYEVVFAKALSVTFGASSLASNTVLATYMGGMALGSWLGSKLAQQSSNPLRLYVVCEAGIGLYALATPALFQIIQRIYIDVAMDRPADASELTALRLGLGAVVLGPITLLMGATFPVMFARLRQLGITSERAIAPLYAANVLGAAFGALFAGYALIPAVGKNSATLIAALVSLLIALYALEKLKYPETIRPQKIEGTFKAGVLPVTQAIGMAAVFILAMGGAITMGLEVLFIHMLSVVAGNSVYAFGLMLAVFLLGLGIGSAAGERAMRFVSRQKIVIIAQCGLAVTIVISALQWDALAAYFSNYGGYAAMGIHINFSGRELIRALVCAIAMMPAAIFIGMNYPACMSLATDWLGWNGREVSGLGKAGGINTIGNISGVLVTGFWLLPSLGSRGALLVLVVASLVTAAAMVLANELACAGNNVPWPKRASVAWAPIGLAACFLGLFPKQWNLDKLSEGSNVYFYPQQWGQIIDHAESTEGGLTTVARSTDGVLTLLTNGKFQGNNAESGEMVAQKSFALIPLMHTTRRDAALVIGYGTGMTPRVVYENGFKSLDIAELSKDVVRLADFHFENINHGVTSKPGVKTYITDGRNFLLTQSKKYDLISIEITSIWFAGAANLYNKEFYDLVAKRLKNDGLLQQWVQLHHMQPLDFLYAMQSLRSTFRYVWFYVSGGQGIVVASNSDNSMPDSAHKALLNSSLKDGEIRVQDLENRLVAGPLQIDSMLSHFDPSMQALLSTDNNLYLEYATPKGNTVRYDTAPIILNLLLGKYPPR